MKLTEEMDVEDVPKTKGDDVLVNKSLETGGIVGPPEGNSKSFTSIGQSGINGGNNETIINGNASPDSPSDVNAIGFEVESYGESDIPMPPTNCSDNKVVANISESNDCSKVNNGTSSNIEISSDIEKFDNENSNAEAEITHDSSHLSEEFELRLSDDEDGNDEISHSRNALSNNGEAVTSTTGDSTSKPRYFGQISKEEAETSESGSGDSKEKGKCDLEDTLENKIVREKTEDLCSGGRDTLENTGDGLKIADSDKHPSSLDEESMLLEGKDSKSETFLPDRAQEGVCEEVTSPGTSLKEPLGLSLEDKLEAELEAELAAEIIAAQKQDEDAKDPPCSSDKLPNDSQSASASVEDNVAVKSSSDDKDIKVSTSPPLSDERKVKVKQEVKREVEEKHKVEQSDVEIKQEVQDNKTANTLPGKAEKEVQIKEEPDDTSDEKVQFNDWKETFEAHENFDLLKEERQSDENLVRVKDDKEISVGVATSKKEENDHEEGDLDKSIRHCKEDVSVESVTSKNGSVAMTGTSAKEVENVSDVPNITADCASLKSSNADVTSEISENSDVCGIKDTAEEVEALEDNVPVPLAKDGDKDDEPKTVEQDLDREGILSVSNDLGCVSSEGSQNQESGDTGVNTSKSEDEGKRLEGRVVSEGSPLRLLSDERSTECDKEGADDSEKSPSNPQQISVPDVDKEIEDKEDLPNPALHAASEPDSPASGNDYDFPIAASREESDSSVSGDDCRGTIDDDFNTNCEKSPAIVSKTNTSADSVRVSGADKVLNSQFTDSNISVSPTFCDSTAQDSFSADDTDSQEYNMNSIAKGYNSDLSSRKRPLSHSEDDSCDSYRSKKFNQLSESNETSDASNSVSDIHHEGGHKRPADTLIDSESKKLRGSDDSYSKKFSSFSNISGINKNSSDLSIGKPVDLPFLRSLHGKTLSEMSRSDLEELVLQKVCEAITERSTVGELRVRCLTLERRQEKENEKFNKLRKQMTELSLVMKKYMEQQKLNKPAPPIKVTRSVGLQVFPCQGSHCHKAPVIKYVQPTAAVNATPTKPDTVPDPSSQKTPLKSPQPVGNVFTSSDPPALVPTGTQNACKVQTPTRPIASTPIRPAVTPQRVAVPPLCQIPGARPRLNIPSSVPSLSPQFIPIQPKQPTPNKPPTPQTSQSAVTTSLAVNDVEVIDIIDKGDQSKRTAEVQISPQQQQYQQKQAQNAAAQSLAGNTGMTVQLIPSQTLSTSTYPQLVVPPQNVRPRMILTSAAQATAVRGSMKLLVKANNVLFPLQTHGTTVPNGVVQQVFTNANANNRTTTVATVRPLQNTQVHPAPLPNLPSAQANNPAWKQVPPKPNLKIQHQNNGIVLSWNMALSPIYAEIDSYQLFAYQEGSAPPSASLWKKVGDVKALPLPMACTLTQFVEGHRYHFTVRAVDKHGRVGPFSQQGSIRLGN